MRASLAAALVLAVMATPATPTAVSPPPGSLVFAPCTETKVVTRPHHALPHRPKRRVRVKARPKAVKRRVVTHHAKRRRPLRVFHAARVRFVSPLCSSVAPGAVSLLGLAPVPVAPVSASPTEAAEAAAAPVPVVPPTEAAEPDEAPATGVTTAPGGGLVAQPPIIRVVVVTPQSPTTPVPEPVSWALMVLGFGFIGFALRHQRGRSAGELP